MTFRCEIVSQDKKVFVGDATMVVLPGSEGEMGILPHHAPLLTSLKFGVITVKGTHESQFFTVSGGIADVSPDGVIVLANAAEDVDEINIQRAEDAKKRAEKMLKESGAIPKDELIALQSAIKRSDLRLEAVKRFRRKRN